MATFHLLSQKILKLNLKPEIMNMNLNLMILSNQDY